MEKIYVEGNNQQQQKQNSNKRLFQVSVVLSFLVAAFAIVSIIAVGFNQVSYAADDEVSDTETDSFTYDGGYDLIGKNSDNNSFYVPVRTQNGTSIYDRFCLEHNAYYGDSYVRTEDDESTLDGGILYILSRSGINDENYSIIPENAFYLSDDNLISKDMINYYAAQVAIWVYLGTEIGVDGNLVVKANAGSRNSLEDYTDDPNDPYNEEPNDASTNFDIIKGISKICILDSGGMTYFAEIIDFYKHIEEVVKEANNYKDSFQQKSLIINGGDDFSLNSDESFYQSSAIDVIGDPSNDLVNYKVTLTGDLVDDVVIVDENGDERDSNVFSANEKFYLRVPSDKVNSDVQTITVNVEATFDNYLTLKLYTPTENVNFQKIVGVDSKHGSEDTSKSLEIVAAEDTGISRTQTVYFIGLIVLLCGIGIIYANAKPIKNN